MATEVAMDMNGVEPLAAILRKCWCNLRLSVRCPERVPTWDAILITAASPEQAHLYQWHLDRAKRRGTIGLSTIAIAVPDPHGARIGSGGATLHALRTLRQHMDPKFQQEDQSDKKSVKIGHVSEMKVLVVHAGGDSKRVPWANPIGKAFLPLPFLAGIDPNGEVPSLFEHILAISSYIVPTFGDKGGLFIMTGDVLPCYDFSDFCAPENGSCIVTVPAAADLASNHGVIITSLNDKDNKFQKVTALLQKPTYGELCSTGAIRTDGMTLLDTGIFAVCGKAWRGLLELATEEPNPVLLLLEDHTEISLYEEIAGAWVPSCHEWLKTRPLGVQLHKSLSSDSLYSFCAQGLAFLHFGTSSEVLAHLSGDHGRIVGRRHMVLGANDNPDKLASSSIILSSHVGSEVIVGEKSLIYECTLIAPMHIGSNCIVVGVHLENNQVRLEYLKPLAVPDEHCLWEVPLFGSGYRVTLCCTIHDNPKLPFTRKGTFCGKLWEDFLHDLGIKENDVWPNVTNNQERSFWNANLFPVVATTNEGIKYATWLMGLDKKHSDNLRDEWQGYERVSLAELHSRIDFQKLCGEFNTHQSKIALGLATSSVTNGSLQYDLSKLCTQIVHGLDSGAEACKDLLALCSNLNKPQVPLSRVLQAKMDISNAIANDVLHGKCAFDAVVKETAVAVGLQEATIFTKEPPPVTFPVSLVKIELPVRIDIAGGWSDTPPWSLEREGKVLNIAILLDGFAPVGAEMNLTPELGISLTDDANNQVFISDLRTIHPPFDNDDPFRLVKSALVVTGLAKALQDTGLTIKTWSNVPRGSGLGTSSILAAAVVKCILRIMGRDDSNENVTSLVLVVEQLMGTGGGWQDQIGGLYPGIKCTTSIPNCPLTLKVEPISINPVLQKQLEERLVVFFSGQVRLAHNVLQTVVRRYLQRDGILISTIEDLVSLALQSQKALEVGNIALLGKIMKEVWLLHQELDPFCSNHLVDTIFRKVDKWACGYKLVGAGGGGFGLVMAKDSEAAVCIKRALCELSVQVYNWRLSGV